MQVVLGRTDNEGGGANTCMFVIRGSCSQAVIYMWVHFPNLSCSGSVSTNGRVLVAHLCVCMRFGFTESESK